MDMGEQGYPAPHGGGREAKKKGREAAHP